MSRGRIYYIVALFYKACADIVYKGVGECNLHVRIFERFIGSAQSGAQYETI